MSRLVFVFKLSKLNFFYNNKIKLEFKEVDTAKVVEELSHKHVNVKNEDDLNGFDLSRD